MSDLDAEARGVVLAERMVVAMERSSATDVETRSDLRGMSQEIRHLTEAVRAVESQQARPSALHRALDLAVRSLDLLASSKISARDVVYVASLVAALATALAGYQSGVVRVPALDDTILESPHAPE